MATADTPQSARSPGDEGEVTGPGARPPLVVTHTLLCFSAAGFPMGYAAAAPAYSPSMYPGASPAFQTGTQTVCAGQAHPAAGRGRGGGSEKRGYRVGA